MSKVKDTVFVIAIITLVVIAIYGQRKYTALIEDPSKLANQQITMIKSNIKDILDLGDDPTISPISTPEDIKASNPNLKDIQQGDIILFYAQAEKAIFYRPTAKRITYILGVSVPPKSEDTSTDPAADNPGDTKATPAPK